MEDHNSNAELELLRWRDKIMRIANEAARKAQEENRRLGIPNVYSINGHIYYELPDGRLSEHDPWEGRDRANGERAASDAMTRSSDDRAPGAR